jgi:DNA-3-methyladenine glycosylase
MSIRLSKSFFQQESIAVAQQLLGKTLVRIIDGTRTEYSITETEAYIGEEDLACHAAKGRTPRTEVMYHAGGEVYVYLIYGIYWLLNFVSGNANSAQAVLIRCITGYNGPGKVGKVLQLDKSFYGEDLSISQRIWVEDAPPVKQYTSLPRVGIDYAGEWKDKLLRFAIESPKKP